MKRIYSLLPASLVKRIRGVIEFDGGVTDTYLLPAKSGHNTWDIITQGTAKNYRTAPASQPQAVIPTEAAGRTFDIAYFTRDARRNPDAAANVPIEASFSPANQLLLPRERLVDKPDTGSPGAKNPDVFRYDASGSRSAMTANWAALQRSLAAARPTHLPAPVWASRPAGESLGVQERLAEQGTFLGVPKDFRKRGWQYSMINDA